MLDSSIGLGVYFNEGILYPFMRNSRFLNTLQLGDKDIVQPSPVATSLKNYVVKHSKWKVKKLVQFDLN